LLFSWIVAELPVLLIFAETSQFWGPYYDSRDLAMRTPIILQDWFHGLSDHLMFRAVPTIEATENRNRPFGLTGYQTLLRYIALVLLGYVVTKAGTCSTRRWWI